MVVITCSSHFQSQVSETKDLPETGAMKEESTNEGSWYWVRDSGGASSGLVVMFSWMFSKRQYHTPYVNLYNSCGWECLICQPHVLNLWFPNRALTLAIRILDELAKELENRPRPVIFASFSGGAKACLYIIYQILQGIKPMPNGKQEKYLLVKACLAGQIYDSSPVDYESKYGVRLVREQLGGYLKHNIVVKAGLLATSKTLDVLFATRFQAEREEYWQALYASAGLGPALILCSKDDKLAPFEVIQDFSTKMRNAGCDVTLISWESSSHVAHLRDHRDDYHNGVSAFLGNAHCGYIGKMIQSDGSSLLPPEELRKAVGNFGAQYALKRYSCLENAEIFPRGRFASAGKVRMPRDEIHDLQQEFGKQLINGRLILTTPALRSRL